ncbi:PilZ domain-containing protein [Crenobacter cavernae]|uniref:PilZ domain-containing protein n=2 Tax=Crenobacter cavernae TaxID=2290923 RepID=A0A345YAF3_9NEIS|nr:PilZ domain-containing protein [Crenobacter cavernae]RXZ42822.1 PilZ domain-containing protein [Crenobacter cavernae]
MGCRARIKSLLTGDVHYGECIDLSVDGIAIRTSFVPRYAERLEVTLRVPPVGNIPAKPFIVEAEVCRCQEVDPGRLYDIGVRIVKRKS